ncbi:radical SAM/SPASM domain-containing protein [Loktanella sp. Alg231-35]|uniref:radical SAM/SPASM domain-containing protein n=1 Tax=Loktanella sp. Alg231-35 TaxID=1922220 RepID=UPI00131EE864|nr:radical SAM/SPASM domain-containing protein [Loktanella sp. Alg231-35]
MNKIVYHGEGTVTENPTARTGWVSDPDPFEHFRRATAAAFPAYFRAMRGRTEDLQIGLAERFAHNWITLNIRAKGSVLADQQDILIDRAMASNGLNGFGLVVAALLALRQQQFVSAEVLASKASAADQHETFAQRITLAAQEQSQTLRLEVDEWLEGRFCSNPFTTAEIIGSKDVFTCCAAWMPAALGNASDDQNSWQSARATEIRRSILDGDFGYCSRVSCPRIAGRELPPRDDAKADDLRRKIEKGQPLPNPRRVLLSYDESCNLSCPSCRSSLILADREKTAALDKFFDQHVSTVLQDASEIKVTGSGDPFGSRHFRNVLKKITAQTADSARLQLQTNGVLFDQRAWDDLGLSGHVRSVWVSIDAAEEETYAKLRRDGDFKRLIENLKMLGELRARDAFAEFRLDFVVQNDNFEEMEDFVALARNVRADGVHFLQLRNWGTYQPTEFRTLEVTRRDHPNHAQLREMLDRPCFADPFVDLGNLAPFRAQKPKSAINTAAAVKKVVVFGSARSGTNYLFEIIRSFREFFVFAELFNEEGAFGLEHYASAGLKHLSVRSGINFAGERDPRLIDFARSQPAAMLSQLTEVAAQNARTALSLKVFPGHFQHDDDLEALVSDPDLVPIILRRQPLAAYASLLQARKMQVWKGADTTGLRVPFEISHFQSWYRIHADWYRALGIAFAQQNQSPLVLEYEAFSQLSPVQIRNNLARHLQDRGLKTVPISDIQTDLNRQDRTQNVFDRFEYPEHVKRSLYDAGYFFRAFAPFEV